MHAVRDSCGDGRSVRRVPRARVLLSPTGEWWESFFDSHYLREYDPLFTPARDRGEVARLVRMLGLPHGSRVLDVPCGQGRHAHLLAEAGYRVEGLDYSETLLRAARKRGTGPALHYTQGDMRKLPARWTNRFDAAVNLFTSFGFFLDPGDDARTIREIARVIKPGGLFVWHGASRDGVMARFLGRDWWRGAKGGMYGQERSFDSLSGILTVRSTWPAGAGRVREREHRIRLYTATRIAELCAAAGMIVEEAFHGWTNRPLNRRSGEMMLVARKVLT